MWNLQHRVLFIHSAIICNGLASFLSLHIHLVVSMCIYSYSNNNYKEPLTAATTVQLVLTAFIYYTIHWIDFSQWQFIKKFTRNGKPAWKNIIPIKIVTTNDSKPLTITWRFIVLELNPKSTFQLYSRFAYISLYANTVKLSPNVLTTPITQ